MGDFSQTHRRHRRIAAFTRHRDPFGSSSGAIGRGSSNGCDYTLLFERCRAKAGVRGEITLSRELFTARRLFPELHSEEPGIRPKGLPVWHFLIRCG